MDNRSGDYVFLINAGLLGFISTFVVACMLWQRDCCTKLDLMWEIDTFCCLFDASNIDRHLHG